MAPKPTESSALSFVQGYFELLQEVFTFSLQNVNSHCEEVLGLDCSHALHRENEVISLLCHRNGVFEIVVPVHVSRTRVVPGIIYHSLFLAPIQPAGKIRTLSTVICLSG